MPGKDLKKAQFSRGRFASTRTSLTAPCGALIFLAQNARGFFMPGKDLERGGSGNEGPSARKKQDLGTALRRLAG
jgi:hypothetical protein